jgi:hypothetical protein
VARSFILAGVAALLLFPACAQVLGIEETELVPEQEPEPEPADDFVDGGTSGESTYYYYDAGPALPGEDFSCLGGSWLPEAEEDNIEIVARIVDIALGTPIEGMSVRVCRSRLDIACAGGDVVQSDAEGLARVEVPKRFDGYLRIEGPDATGAERVGYLWYFSQPLLNTYVFPIFSMTPDFRDQVIYGELLGSGIERDPERGEIAINVTDCSPPDPATQDVEGEPIANAPGVNAPDVHFEISDEELVDAATRQFYFSDGNPVWPRQIEDQVTDSTGLGGFLNVQPGPIPLRAVPQWLGDASGTDTLLVRAGFLTTVRLLPE